MKPIPVAFHVGPLEIHTYGIGLAITFYVAYRYFERRLRQHGYRSDWLVGVFLWVVLSAVVGARALHVLSNLSIYTQSPGDILAIWHGGLSSFGGILFAVPLGLYLAHRRCPELSTARALDLVAPVLMAAWAMGRLLGPQLMVAGGGHPTHQWFGMYYAGQTGRRLPVPIFQALEDFTVFLILIWIERRLDRWPDGRRRVGYPTGVVLGTGMVLWGIERFADEHLWLGEDGHLGSLLVQIAGIALAVGGVIVLLRARLRWRQWLATGAPGGHGDTDGPVADRTGIDETPSPESTPVAATPVAATPAGSFAVPTASSGRAPGNAGATEGASGRPAQSRRSDVRPGRDIRPSDEKAADGHHSVEEADDR